MSTSIRTKALTGVAVAFLTLGMAACTDDTPPEPTPTVEPAPVEDPSDSGGDETPTSNTPEDPIAAGDGCTLPPGEQSLPNQAPDVDAWLKVQGIGVPTSDTYGPQKQDGELFTCYAQSPTGALFASVYVFAASGYVEGFSDHWVEEGTIPGAEESEGDAAPLPGVITLRGYRFVAASQEQTTVDLAFELATDSGTNVEATRVILDWNEDHWVVSPEILETENIAVPEGMDGYTPWSPNG